MNQMKTKNTLKFKNKFIRKKFSICVQNYKEVG